MRCDAGMHSPALNSMDGEPGRLFQPVILSDLRPGIPVTPTPELIEHERRLEAGFEFSRLFVLTLQPGLIVLVLLVAAWRIYSRRARAWGRARRKSGKPRRRRDEKNKSTPRNTGADSDSGEGTQSSSSSSSTRWGDASPPPRTIDEFTGLLDEDGTRTTSQDTTKPSSTIARWTRFVLTYQPRRLPLLHRNLPPNKTTLWVIVLFLIELFYLLFQVPLSPDTPSIVGDRAGLLFVANLPWLYLLAAKTQPLKLLTGDSYENLNMLHRRLGEWLCFLAVVHLGGLLWGWYDFLRPAGLSLVWLLTVPFVACGCGAWVAYEALYLTSLGSFREWWYEVFLGSHIVLQFGALILLFLHHFRSRPYVLVSLAIFLLDRLAWRLWTKAWDTQAQLKVLDDGETVLISADWPVKPHHQVSRCQRLFGHDMRSGWKPSEHVFIGIPGMGKKYKCQWHPITIASAAPGPGQTHAWFNLIIRAKGGFSRDLLHYAQSTASATIRLDGPYGSMHALEMLQESDVSIVVAGGSGIAVAYPLIWSLLHQPSRSDTPAASSTPIQPKVCLIWIVHDASHVSWIGRERLTELEELGLHLVIPPSTRTHGRADASDLLGDKVEHLAQPHASIAVVVSGPDGLNRTVQNACARMIKRGLDVSVAVEKFGW